MARARCAGISSPCGEARAFRVDRRLALGLVRLGPAFGADQRHEGDGAVVLLLELVIVDAADEQQRLMGAAADRDHEPPANGELLLQRLRHFRAAGRDEDGVERGLVRQSLGAVGEDDLDIGVAEPLRAARAPGRRAPRGARWR